MADKLDDQIDRVLAQLNFLKRQKLAQLQHRMRALESESSPKAAPDRRYRNTTGPEAEEILKKAMNEAGDKGLSALKAAEKTGIPYAQVRALMPGLFKKTGSGGHTVYLPKQRSAGSKS